MSMEEEEEQRQESTKVQDKIPGGGESNGKMKSPRDLWLSPKASDHVQASENNKKANAETSIVASKNACANKIKEIRHSLIVF